MLVNNSVAKSEDFQFTLLKATQKGGVLSFSFFFFFI